MATNKKTIKTAERSTGKKKIIFLDPEGSLEETFQDLIAKGANIDLKDAGKYDNYSDFAMFVKDCLKQGKFTKVEFLEALYKDYAEEEYEKYKESYPDTDDSFVNFIQDDHCTYSSFLVFETEDEIYLTTIEECDAEESYYYILKELALAITNIHPARIQAKEPSKEVLDIMSKLTTTEKSPTTGAGVKVLAAPMFTKL